MSNNDPCNTDRPVRCLQSLVRPAVAGVVTVQGVFPLTWRDAPSTAGSLLVKLTTSCC